MTLQVMLLGTTMSCSAASERKSPTPPSDKVLPAASTGQGKCVEVAFHSRADTPTFCLEVADTTAAQAQGLMFRRELAARGGMLFVFTEDAPRQFWMKNTYIPLDMIFLDSKQRVVGIVAQAEPQTRTGRGVAAASRYVIELAGGAAAQAQITIGTQAVFLAHAKASQ